MALCQSHFGLDLNARYLLIVAFRMANSRYIAFIALFSIILWANNASAQPDVIRIAFEISNIAQIDLTTATFWLGMFAQFFLFYKSLSMTW